MQAKPIEVFAIDGLMNRATGSIPYTSLTWHRRYYEPGEFSMTIPASLFNPSWRFIETDERPETGIIQKVEFTDTPTYGSDDTVTVSGFFLESILNRHTFLDETPEQVTERYYVSPPSPPSASLTKPKIYEDSSGNFWYSTPAGTSYGVADGTPSSSANRRPGGAISDNGDGTASVESGGQTVQLTEVDYGTQINSYYYQNENGYQNDGQIFRSQLMADGEHVSVHEVAFDDGFGNVYYHDSDTGSIKRATGTTTKAGDNYTVQRRKWRSTTDNGWVTVTKTVKGPWQLTDTLDPITPADNVSRCVQWAQMYLQNEVLFEEPEITGEVKAVNPSFMLLGDLLYQELQTVGASFRLEYDFPTNQFVFSIWQGLDRTQEGNSKRVEKAAERRAGVRAAVARAAQWANLPDGYTQVEYVQGSGTQYVDTGVKLNGNLRISASIELDDAGGNVISGVLGARQKESGSFILWKFKDGFRFDYGSEQKEFGSYSQSTLYEIDLNRNTGTVNDYSVAASAASFTSSLNVYLLSVNDYGEVDSRMCIGTLYSAKVYDDGALVRDFVPCKRDSDNSAGLYDLVGKSFYGNAGTGSFTAGPVVSPPADQLEYYANDPDATGSTLPTEGVQGEAVTVAECDFKLSGHTFREWNTLQDGTGTTYHPGDSYTLTSGFDYLYAQWDENAPMGGNSWAVFSDTWGSLYGFTASRDESNYRNTCHVLYDYDAPTSWASNGAPALSPVYEWNDSGTSRTLVGYRVPYATKRGFLTVKIDDGLDARETYLDLRNSPPAGDDEWSRQMYDVDSVPALPSLKATYDAYEAGLESQGMAKLTNDYPVITSLDTGDLDLSRYLADYDLGDLVDMSVSTVGLEQAARIIGVVEVYESGKSTVTLEIGEKQLTILQKARLN